MSNQAPAATADISRIEAPVTWKAYLICMFASTGGLLFGYDSGYINGVIGNPIFIREVEGPYATSLTGSHCFYSFRGHLLRRPSGWRRG